MTPQRVQITRSKPWRADNPDAVIVDRRTVWGNPYHAGRCYDPRLWAVGSDLLGDAVGPRFHSEADAIVEAVKRFRGYARRRLAREPAWLDGIRGHDLACWCKPGAPCHADILLELANP